MALQKSNFRKLFRGKRTSIYILDLQFKCVELMGQYYPKLIINLSRAKEDICETFQIQSVCVFCSWISVSSNDKVFAYKPQNFIKTVFTIEM